MGKAHVFHLRLSEDAPLQRQTLDVIRSIPKGSRTAELCRMILFAKETADLRQLISDTVHTAVQNSLSALSSQSAVPRQPNTNPQGEGIPDDILSFLSELQEGGDI